MAQLFNLETCKSEWCPDTQKTPGLALELSRSALLRFEGALRDSVGAAIDGAFSWDGKSGTPLPEGAVLERVLIEMPVTADYKYSLAAAFIPAMVDALAWKARELGITKFGVFLGDACGAEGGVSTGDVASLQFVMQMCRMDYRAGGGWAEVFTLAFIGAK